eukprot:ANDGO_04149.mRNA.1 hypothetical protein
MESPGRNSESRPWKVLPSPESTRSMQGAYTMPHPPVLAASNPQALSKMGEPPKNPLFKSKFSAAEQLSMLRRPPPPPSTMRDPNGFPEGTNVFSESRNISRLLNEDRRRNKLMFWIMGIHVVLFWAVVGLLVYNTLMLQSLARESNWDVSKMTAKQVTTSNLQVSSSGPQSVSVESTNNAASLSVMSSVGAASLVLDGADSPISLLSRNGELVMEAGNQPAMKIAGSGSSFNGSVSTSSLKANTIDLSAGAASILSFTTSPSLSPDGRIVTMASDVQTNSMSFAPSTGLSIAKGASELLLIKDNVLLNSIRGGFVQVNDVLFVNQTVQLSGLVVSSRGISVRNGSLDVSTASGDVSISAGHGIIVAQSDVLLQTGRGLYVSDVFSPSSQNLTLHSSTGSLTLNVSSVFIGPAEEATVALAGSLRIVAGSGAAGTSAIGHGSGGSGVKGGDVSIQAGAGGAGGSSGGFSGAGGNAGSGGNVLLVHGTGGSAAAVDILQTSVAGADGEVIVSASCLVSGAHCGPTAASRMRISSPSPVLSLGDKDASFGFRANSSSASSSLHLFSDAYGGDVVKVGSSAWRDPFDTRATVNIEQGVLRIRQENVGYVAAVVSPLSTTVSLISQVNSTAVSFNNHFFVVSDSASLHLFSSSDTAKRLELRASAPAILARGLPFSFVDNTVGMQQVIITSERVHAANGSTIQVGSGVVSFSDGLVLRSRESAIQFKDSASVISINATSYLSVDSPEPTRFLAGIALCTASPAADPTCANSILLNGTSASISSASLALDFSTSTVTTDKLYGRNSLFLSSTTGVFVDSTRPLSGVTLPAAGGLLSDLQIFFFNSTVLSRNSSIYLKPADALVVTGSQLVKVGSLMLSGQTSVLSGPGMVLDYSANALGSTSGQGLVVFSHSSLKILASSSSLILSASASSRLLLQDGARIVDGSTMVLNFSAASLQSLGILYMNPLSEVVVQGTSGSTTVTLGDRSVSENIRMTPTSVTGASLQLLFSASPGVPGATSSIKDSARDLVVSSLYNKVVLAAGAPGIMVEVSPEAFTASGGSASPRMSTSKSSFYLDFGTRTVGTSAGTESLVLRGGNDVQITGTNRIVFGSTVTAQSLTVCGSCGVSSDQYYISGLQLKMDFVGSSLESQTGDMIISSPAVAGVVSLRSTSGVRLKSASGTTGLNMRDENSNVEIDFAARLVRSMTGELTILGEASTRIVSGDAGLFLLPLGSGPSKPLKIIAGAADSALYYQRPVATCAGTYTTFFAGQNAIGGCASGGGAVVVSAGSAFQGAGGDVSLIAGDNTAAPGKAGDVYLISGQNIGGSIGDTLVQTRQMNVYFRGAQWKVLSVGTSTVDGDFVYVGNTNSSYAFDTDAYTDLIVTRSRIQSLVAAETITISNEIPVSRNILTSIQIGHPTDMTKYTQLIYARALRYRFVDPASYTGFYMDPISILLNRSHSIDVWTTNLTARSEGFLDFQTGTQGVRMGPIDTLRTLAVEIGSVKAPVEIYRPQSNGVAGTYTKLIGQDACTSCGAGGGISIYGGNAHSTLASDTGGSVELRAGQGAASSSGGSISLVAGSALGAGTGGSLSIAAGAGAGTSTYGGVNVRTRWFDVRQISATYSLLRIDTHPDDTSADHVDIGNVDSSIPYTDTRYTNKVQVRATEFAVEVGSQMNVVPAQSSSSQFLVGSNSVVFSAIQLRASTTTIYDGSNVAALTIAASSATLSRSTTLSLETTAGTGTIINVGTSTAFTENVYIRGTTVKIFTSASSPTVTVQNGGNLLISVGASNFVKIVSGDVDVQAGKFREYGNSILPKGSIILFRGSACPPGYTFVSDTADRVLVGAVTSTTASPSSLGPLVGVSSYQFQVKTSSATVNLPDHGHAVSTVSQPISGYGTTSVYSGPAGSGVSNVPITAFQSDSKNINQILPGVYILVCEKDI